MLNGPMKMHDRSARPRVRRRTWDRLPEIPDHEPLDGLRAAELLDRCLTPEERDMTTQRIVEQVAHHGA